MASLLRDYVENHRKGGNKYLFPATISGNKLAREAPLSTSGVSRIIKRLAADAGVHGNHVHPHAFRKHVVTALIEAGNRIEYVSRFVGHANIQTTLHYWDLQYEIVQRLNMSPLLTPPISPDLALQDMASVSKSTTSSRANEVIQYLTRFRYQEMLIAEMSKHIDADTLAQVYESVQREIWLRDEECVKEKRAAESAVAEQDS